LPPSGNFELIDWKLQNYLDVDGNGRSDQVDEEDLANGFENPDFFYTASDGGMVFKVPIAGAKTSTNTSYTRTELREMLRRGDRSYSTQGVGKNNWVFSSAPQSDQTAAGGVDGTLTGTLAVNHVTTTGADNQVGRVIFAQIHANDDEPIRFYYRKLPNNTKGSIYFAHEPVGETDVYYEMVGSRSQSQSDPADGIALDEKFSYEINTLGNILTVKLIRTGKVDIVETVDMSGSGYDVGGQYMYFKAGAYIQDNTGLDDDFAQVTYYALHNEHN
jgi:poly(beta-D-mannuronate) lyase